MEQTLLAHFTFPEQAEKARNALVEAGLDIVQVDHVDQQASSRQVPLVEWGRYGYQADGLDDKWTSAAAWDNQLNIPGADIGEGILLTAVVDEDRADEARGIIKHFGGAL